MILSDLIIKSLDYPGLVVAQRRELLVLAGKRISPGLKTGQLSVHVFYLLFQPAVGIIKIFYPLFRLNGFALSSSQCLSKLVVPGILFGNKFFCLSQVLSRLICNRLNLLVFLLQIIIRSSQSSILLSQRSDFFLQPGRLLPGCLGRIAGLGQSILQILYLFPILPKGIVESFYFPGKFFFCPGITAGQTISESFDFFFQFAQFPILTDNFFFIGLFFISRGSGCFMAAFSCITDFLGQTIPFLRQGAVFGTQRISFFDQPVCFIFKIFIPRYDFSIGLQGFFQ